MTKSEEVFISEKKDIPPVVYHVVPGDLFLSFVGTEGSYDCRNSDRWGKGSRFIHTTTDVKTIKEKIIGNFISYDLKIPFKLLKIKTEKVTSAFSYVDQNGTRYFHIWGPLPKGSFEIFDIPRTNDGGFVINQPE
jgi:hypothetical protein